MSTLLALGNNKPKISVLLCTLNEEKNLPLILPCIPYYVDEVIIVDGHSKDDTVPLAKKLYPKAKIFYQPDKGKGDALKYGIKKAEGDIIVTIDADGSMNLEDISKFIEPLLNGYDFSKGTRFLPGGGTSDMSNHRKFGNWVFTTLANILHGCHYTDITYGYNAFWKKSLEPLSISGNGFETEIEINIKIKKKGLKIIEIPSFESPRINGTGKLHSLKDGWRILSTIIREIKPQFNKDDNKELNSNLNI